ncbi:carboxypeptidase regulatory-like domain-containing protein [Streptomyces sp. NBC_00243]|uniref:carboxypeptidase regulatory-like domain-containing protein n=1 Tax=Streptomyces sp. NBC_00243 TaxID=2975688 RepID=UPI002DDA6189|nr:carboxypeptidase regulatory-like domain-containing protein [Streptomyces sp. NBC_00243]WRZ18874.1 carboxypeptidase regulatory-like domain-containing protein [Streptomyces sp. NBC_00243]
MPYISVTRLRRRVSSRSAANSAVGRLTARLMAPALALATVIAVPAASYAADSPDPLVPETHATSPTAPGQHPTSSVCGEPSKAGEMACMSMRRDDVTAPMGVQASAVPVGFGPADLTSAYNLPSGGTGQTVAIVDAYDNPNAESDLAVYREQYGLPPCTTANGCFRKIDQRGGTDYPPYNAGWAGEISLDIDMVSAVCPSCNILLVEADDAYMNNLGTAVNQAVAQGAKFVSNSYGANEGPDGTQSDDAYFRHPGVVVTASTGDSGYGVMYPAASQYVTAVGGTSLVKDTSSRGWAEAAWSGAGSGCSAYTPKPSFQTDTGCARRSNADVSAVADPNTGVAVYDGGWQVYGGTSVSAPIIASVYALGGAPAAGSEPNSFPYAETSALNDVTSGSNGSCETAYLCTAGPGYDGPTGLGTPSGVGAFRSGQHGTVTGTVTDGTTPLAQAKVSVGDTTVTTDGAGRYSLNVPTGTYDVTAAKFGYTSRTVSDVTLTDGQTVTENFELPAKPQVQVTGTVSDGSGHGWPLYATVQVEGEPTAVTYTDPETGRYSLSLPAGTDYTLQADVLYPGYNQDSVDVAVGSTDLAQDISPTVDQVTCSAAGYAYKTDGTTESFDSTTTPSGWTVDDKIGNGQIWAFDNPYDRGGNRTGGKDGFATVDSFYYGYQNSQDTSLISPVLDFSERTRPVTSFRSDYVGYTTQVADVDYTVDGGRTWKNVWHQTADARGPRSETVDLSAAVGESAVQVRFHFTSTFGVYWSIDDVFFGNQTCAPTTGGLVVGQVLDKNTGGAVNGATITSADQPTVSTTSAATPDDPNLGDGFYWLYSSLTGSHTFTATAGNHYTSADVTVDVAADKATEGVVSLTAPQLEVDPASISETVDWQGQASRTVTVRNTGTAPVTAKIGERQGAYQPAAQGAPLQKVPGDYTPERMPSGKTTAETPANATATPYAAPWTTVADYPTPIMDNAAATIDGKVYSVGGIDASGESAKGYVYDPVSQAWSALPNMTSAREAPQAATSGGKLYVFGGWGSTVEPVATVEIYNPSSRTWSTGATNPKPYAGAAVSVLGGKFYLVGGCDDIACGTTDVQVYDPVADTWSSAKAYPETTSWLGCGAIDNQMYCAGGTKSSTTSKHTYVYDPTSDSWTPGADLPIDLWAMGYSVANDQLLVSGGVTSGNSAVTNQGFTYDPHADSWSALPNSNNTAYRGAAACGFYKIGGSTGGASLSSASEVLPGYDQCAGTDVTWLSSDTTNLTLQPGASATVTVSLNANVAAITQPGTYTAALSISAKTPYAVPSLAVTLVVNPPKTWGKITGTVTGVACTGTSAPLAGATVAIYSAAATYTLKTDTKGQYVLWLDTRNNPLTLIAARDGWTPQTAPAKLAKLKTTTADFALKPDHPCS